MTNPDAHFSVELARLYDVRPEDITLEFLQEIRQRMQKDTNFQRRSACHLKGERVPPLTKDEEIAWDIQCKSWAKEILRAKSAKS